MNKMLEGVIAPVPRYEWEKLIADLKHDLLIGLVETDESLMWLSVVNALDATITGRTRQSVVDFAIGIVEKITPDVQDAQNEAFKASQFDYEVEMQAWAKHEEQEANPFN